MSHPLTLHISAIDTLMFRDGRPFNQADAGASEAVSVFPPYPPTIVGAVRAALWKHNGTWSKDVLGDGTNWQSKNNILNLLKFGPPQLLSDGVPVFPVPLHIVEGKDENGEKRLTCLVPGASRESDLGNVRLPEPYIKSLKGIKTIEDRWVTASGMVKILNGQLPNQKSLKKEQDTETGVCDLIERKLLWRSEPRVGIGIDRESRTTSKAQLYMATHTRMQGSVSLSVELEGFEQDKNNLFKKTLQPLAGEHRMAEIKICQDNPVRLPKRTEALDDGRYCITLLSPLVIDRLSKAGEKLPCLPGEVISACLGKPMPIGGWDSQGRKPIPLRQCIPTGSVWFMQGNNDLKPEDIPSRIGLATEWGFGQILIGKW